MKTLNQSLLTSLVSFAIITGTATNLFANDSAVPNEITTVESDLTNTNTTLDENERTHLFFMREEEKLARDVYIKLGELYPDSPIFGKIDNSEQIHTTAVKMMIEKYGLTDPSTNDNVGVYTGEEYGEYFTEKFNLLVERASTSELEALHVGAFIEELDMMDINQCPKVIVEADNGINDISECGKIYTQKSDIQNLYNSLLDGSDSHLESYVSKIEKQTGAGSYLAQVLPQEQVNKILGR